MQHLDEGTIHAWLDGQLPPDEAAAAEAHVAGCRPCADAVAEARGLIAASSRILVSLDGVPRDVAPRAAAPGAAAPGDAAPPLVSLPVSTPRPTPAQHKAQRRWLRGPSLAAAAMLVVAVGTFALDRASRRDENLSIAADAPTASTSGPAAGAPAEVATNAPVQAPAPAAPVAAALGAAATANEARDVAAAVRARALASGARAEADQSAGRTAPPALAPARADAFAPGADGARPGAAQQKREEAKALAKVAPPALVDGSSRLKERAADSLQQGQAARLPFGVTVFRGQQADTAAARATRASAEQPARDRRSATADAAAPAPTGIVRGRVTDGNNTGLASVMVTIDGTSIGGTTNETGEYTLGGVQPGSHRLAVRRVGFEPVTRELSVAAGSTTTTDVVMKPAQLSLEQLVVTGTATAQRGTSVRGRSSIPAAARDTAPGAAVTAVQSTAVGCYELGITPVAQQARLNFRRTPRRVSLDAEIVPSNADGVWYRARDLAQTGAVPDGLWRPVGTDGIELEWTYGTQLARLRLTGPVSRMMRGTVQEIDRANGTGEAASVVSRRAPCP